MVGSALAVRHRLAHWLGWHLGRVVSALDRNGTIWIGFRCGTCGKVNGIHATHPPRADRFT